MSYSSWSSTVLLVKIGIFCVRSLILFIRVYQAKHLIHQRIGGDRCCYLRTKKAKKGTEECMERFRLEKGKKKIRNVGVSHG